MYAIRSYYVRVSGRQILVHSITQEMADDLLSGEMDRRVTRMEGGPPPKARNNFV